MTPRLFSSPGRRRQPAGSRSSFVQDLRAIALVSRTWAWHGAKQIAIRGNVYEAVVLLASAAQHAHNALGQALGEQRRHAVADLPSLVDRAAVEPEGIRERLESGGFPDAQRTVLVRVDERAASDFRRLR